jgi:hypothetical protein
MLSVNTFLLLSCFAILTDCFLISRLPVSIMKRKQQITDFFSKKAKENVTVAYSSSNQTVNIAPATIPVPPPPSASTIPVPPLPSASTIPVPPLPSASTIPVPPLPSASTIPVPPPPSAATVSVALNPISIPDDIGDKNSGPFHPSIFFKLSNGQGLPSKNYWSQPSFQFASFSRKKECTVCWVCIHYGSESFKSTYWATGFSNWKSFVDKWEKHASSSIHAIAVARYKGELQANRIGAVIEQVQPNHLIDDYKN